MSLDRSENLCSPPPGSPPAQPPADRTRPLDLAIVLPTYNERDNIPRIISLLGEVLHGLSWEAIFVDDNSPDGTAQVVAQHALDDKRIRLIHRLNERGLASACIDGMLATLAPFIAVMDADLQHDESILPRMLARMRDQRLDLIIGTRNSEGGSMGEFGRRRVLLSRLGEKIGHAVCRCRITDPMSGFFMVRRDLVADVAPRLQRSGFKILVDILASSKRPVSLGEIGYTFRSRRYGESKLDVFVGIEYLSLVLNRMIGDILPTRMGLFLLVGGIGLITHLVALSTLREFTPVPFIRAQIVATFCAMMGNFYFNNIITFRDRRLRGLRMLSGGARFVLACSVAAWANILFARSLWASGAPWYAAGFGGILLGSLWNLSVSSRFTWGIQPHILADPCFERSFASQIEIPN